MISATYMQIVHVPLSYDSHAGHINSIKKTNMFVFVMLCVLCSLRRWEPNSQIPYGIILCLKYLKYFYALHKELSTERYVITVR